MEITLSNSKSAIIPAEIAHEKCKVLIDTGASRSFIREDYFKRLQDAKLMPTLRNVRLGQLQEEMCRLWVELKFNSS